ncbi:hypothetical protein K438DRAFT_1834819 [Mycena galopus ATCC 62051]|nr:hypothetical protein K438DRAFT_1834819 [Mycena galopus ATCC 62051]
MVVSQFLVFLSLGSRACFSPIAHVCLLIFLSFSSLGRPTARFGIMAFLKHITASFQNSDEDKLLETNHTALLHMLGLAYVLQLMQPDACYIEYFTIYPPG